MLYFWKVAQDKDLKFGKTKGGLRILTSVFEFANVLQRKKIHVTSASVEFHSGRPVPNSP